MPQSTSLPLVSTFETSHRIQDENLEKAVYVLLDNSVPDDRKVEDCKALLQSPSKSSFRINGEKLDQMNKALLFQRASVCLSQTLCQRAATQGSGSLNRLAPALAPLKRALSLDDLKQKNHKLAMDLQAFEGTVLAFNEAQHDALKADENRKEELLGLECSLMNLERIQESIITPGLKAQQDVLAHETTALIEKTQALNLENQALSHDRQTLQNEAKEKLKHWQAMLSRASESNTYYTLEINGKDYHLTPAQIDRYESVLQPLMKADFKVDPSLFDQDQLRILVQFHQGIVPKADELTRALQAGEQLSCVELVDYAKAMEALKVYRFEVQSFLTDVQRVQEGFNFNVVLGDSAQVHFVSPVQPSTRPSALMAQVDMARLNEHFETFGDCLKRNVRALGATPDDLKALGLSVLSARKTLLTFIKGNRGRGYTGLDGNQALLDRQFGSQGVWQDPREVARVFYEEKRDQVKEVLKRLDDLGTRGLVV